MENALILFSAAVMSFAGYSLGYAKARVDMATAFRDRALGYDARPGVVTDSLNGEK